MNILLQMYIYIFEISEENSFLYAQCDLFEKKKFILSEWSFFKLSDTRPTFVKKKTLS
jgi:hypothetical protein